jgi:Predicted phosphoesterases, related to the Icc protein
MKFLVVTDIHGKRSAVDWINRAAKENNTDCVLILGDITDFGPDDTVEKILSEIEQDVYAIPGNCDPLSIPSVVGRFGTDMHGKCIELNGLTLVGLGGSNPSPFGTPFEMNEDVILKELKKVSKKGMILMVHAPPYGFNDTIPTGLNVGSRSIAKIVEEFKPILVLSGHIHEAVGIVVSDGTTFINPGPAMEGKCAVVEVNGGKVEAKLLGPLG